MAIVSIVAQECSIHGVRKAPGAHLTKRPNIAPMKTETRDERFASWMRDHVAILHRVAHGFAEGADRADLVQEMMLALWRAAPSFSGASQPSTFIYRVAHNAALLWHRTERKHRRRVAVAPEIGWMAEPDTARARADTPARLNELYAAIRTLPALDRSLILLSLDGLGYRAIAELHGLSESNVGARLTRLRARLTAQLTQEIVP